MDDDHELNAIPSPPPSPPPPPSLIFDPPLYLQRRRAIHELLRQLSGSEIFGKNKITSVLDVGCGTDLTFLRSLLPCEDDLPLENVTGLDIDDGLLSLDLVRTLIPPSDEEKNRWRELTVRLLHGSFERLSPELVPRHDAIVSSEVIEHLDPGPLSNYAPVLLGKMRPKICILTTPNRDFNKVFDHALPHDPSKRYFRPNIPYAMRHHDHRFEWTRAQFRAWAKDAAVKWGYRVVFAGVGSLDCGVVCEDPLVRQFLEKETDEFVGIDDDWFYNVATSSDTMLGQGLEDVLGNPELSKTPSYLRHAHRVLGSCSQIAIFMLQGESEAVCGETVIPKYWDGVPKHDLKLVCQHVYPYSRDEIYPPSYLKAIDLLQVTFPSFIPGLLSTAWDRIGKPFLGPDRTWNEDLYEGYGYEELSTEELEEHRLAREESRRKDKLRTQELKWAMAGMHPDEVEVARVVVEPLEVWDRSWELQRAFRFHYKLFESMIMRSGKEGGVESYAQNYGEDFASDDADSDPNWKTIYRTPTTILELYNPSTPTSTKPKVVRLTVNGPQRYPPVLNSPSLPALVPSSGEDSTPEDDSLPEENQTAGLDDYRPQIGVQFDGTATDSISDFLLPESASSGRNSAYSALPEQVPVQIHAVAVWSLDDTELEDESMGVEVGDETKLLLVPRKQELCPSNGKIILTFFKPQEEEDIWGMMRSTEGNYQGNDELKSEFGEANPGWGSSDQQPPSDDDYEEYENIETHGSEMEGTSGSVSEYDELYHDGWN